MREGQASLCTEVSRFTKRGALLPACGGDHGSGNSSQPGTGGENGQALSGDALAPLQKKGARLSVKEVGGNVEELRLKP